MLPIGINTGEIKAEAGNFMQMGDAKPGEFDMLTVFLGL